MNAGLLKEAGQVRRQIRFRALRGKLSAGGDDFTLGADQKQAVKFQYLRLEVQILGQGAAALPFPHQGDGIRYNFQAGHPFGQGAADIRRGLAGYVA